MRQTHNAHPHGHNNVTPIDTIHTQYTHTAHKIHTYARTHTRTHARTHTHTHTHTHAHTQIKTKHYDLLCHINLHTTKLFFVETSCKLYKGTTIFTIILSTCKKL